MCIKPGYSSVANLETRSIVAMFCISGHWANLTPHLAAQPYCQRTKAKKSISLTNGPHAYVALSVFLGCAEAQSVFLNIPIVGRNCGPKVFFSEEQKEKGNLVSLLTVARILLRLINGEKHERVFIFRF